MEFGYMLERIVSRYPDKTAIVFEDKRLTFDQFNQRVNCLANALLDLGIKHQERIGIVCHNSNNYLEIIFACANFTLSSPMISFPEVSICTCSLLHIQG